MKQQLLELLRKNPDLQDAEILETHISWLLLTPDKVYKMKKNVRFSFLDFSTSAKRRFYCERELVLNRRLAPRLYEAVVAVNPAGEGLAFGPYRCDSVDYAIRMRRIAPEWTMNRMLAEDRIMPVHLDRLAGKLAAFHRSAEPDRSLFNPIKVLDDFGDIARYAGELAPYLGERGVARALRGVAIARSFLRAHHQRFHDRRMLGFTVDGHGDLHSGNVFLEHGEPIVFDCIEFNDELRRVDVLDEVAFLTVDLEASGRRDLAERFLASYQSANRTLITEEDELLFSFYKCYRANVRMKVTAIKVARSRSDADTAALEAQLHRYLEIYSYYADLLKASGGVSSTVATRTGGRAVGSPRV